MFRFKQNFLGVTLGVSLFSLNTFATTEYTHPLVRSIKNLTQIVEELKSLGEQSPTNMKSEIDQLKNRTDELLLNALMLPIRAIDSRFRQLGFELVVDEVSPLNFKFRENEKALRIREEAESMEAVSWVSLASASDEARTEIESFMKAMNQKYSPFLSMRKNDELDSMVN